MDEGGFDSTTGREFSNPSDMWAQEIGLSGGSVDGDKRQDWYRKGIGYWQGVEASVDGVLGGLGFVNDVDVTGSVAFLKPLLAERFSDEQRHLVALDCGAGIGRVTKNLLLRFFNEVDLVEPVPHFLEAARNSLVPQSGVEQNEHRASNFYCLPLQEFTPEAGRYDVIWIQWCIGQLPDDDFVSFFNRAKAGLKHSGFFVVKENISRTVGFVLDKEDNSVTRSDLYFRELFQQCGLHIIAARDQRGLPKELFAVKMYALALEKPIERPTGAGNKGMKKRRKNSPALI